MAVVAVFGCGKEGPVETVPEKALGPPVAAPEEPEPQPADEERSLPTEKAPNDEDADVVSSYVLEGKRISGVTQIRPSERVKKEMVLSKLDKLAPVVEMCLDENGEVKSLELLRTSGFREYDEQILGAMSHWKYEPHVVAGEPRPICTHIRFVYDQSEKEEEPKEAIGRAERR